jgi:Domain of unknown function (DUF4382)
MDSNMLKRAVSSALIAGLAGGLVACGGGGSGPSSTVNNVNPTPQSAQVPLVLSDATSDDWALVGVKVLSIALIPQGGGTAVTVFTAPTPAPMVNLEELDQIGEILGNLSVPYGTYTSAVVTISANAGDIALTVAADPEAGFQGTPGASIPSDQIDIQHTQGSSGSLTVPVNVAFVQPLVVNGTGSNALDLEFDLGHPAFIVGHTPPGSGGTTIWAVNFQGPLRHHPVADVAALVLRHTYGNVTAVSSDNASIMIDKVLPTLPIVNPETSVDTSRSLQILADSTNGTLFYDLDAGTRTTIMDFSAEATTLSGKYVRVAARYQEDGTLVAVRIWASTQFDKVWLSPEGHVLHVNPSQSLMTVLNELGQPVDVAVNSSTQFFFRTPLNPAADAQPIATGTTFLTSGDLVRGFKVHVSVNPLVSPMTAETVDIETAAYSGRISGATSSQFTYTHKFGDVTDDYTATLDYITSTSPNGLDGQGNPVNGYKWWDFTYPTLMTTGANAAADFATATNGGVSFGGTVGAVNAWGISGATWADPANPSGWSAAWSILEPTPIPLGVVSTAYANNAFAMTVAGGATAVTVDVSTAQGAATLAYQIDRSGNIVTVSQIDLTSSSDLTTFTQAMTAGVPVKVFGVPQADGTLKAYVIAYYTGMAPAS